MGIGRGRDNGDHTAERYCTNCDQNGKVYTESDALVDCDICGGSKWIFDDDEEKE